MAEFRNTNELIDALVQKRMESATQLSESADGLIRPEQLKGEAVTDDPDVQYRIKIIDSIEDLAESICENLSKVGVDSSHYYVTSLIEIENALRDLNEDICSFCDASNNLAMEDSEKLNDKLDQLGNFDEFEDNGDSSPAPIGVDSFIINR